MENGSEKTALKGASKMKMKHRQNKTKKSENIYNKTTERRTVHQMQYKHILYIKHVYKITDR